MAGRGAAGLDSAAATAAFLPLPGPFLRQGGSLDGRGAARRGAAHRRPRAAIERHKGGGAAALCMDGKRSPAAVAVWRAAADARAWAATLREHMAWKSYVRGQSIITRAHGTMMRSVGEGRGAVDAQNRMGADAMGRAAVDLRRVARLTWRAAGDFGLSSDLHRAAVAELKRASAAYRRAAAPMYAVHAAERIAMLNEYATTEAQIGAGAERVAGRIGSLADALAADAARLEADGKESGKRPEWLAPAQADALVGAGLVNAISPSMIESARKIEQSAAALSSIKDAAGRSSAAAEAHAAADPGARAAASAWKRGMRAVERAAWLEARIRRRNRRLRRAATGLGTKAGAESGASASASAPPGVGEIEGGGAPDAGAGDATGPAAAAVWRAAADARMWSAALHAQAMSTARREGWAARAKVADALARAAEACGQLVGTPGSIDEGAMVRMLEAHKDAASLLGLADKAFRRMSESSRAAAVEEDLAAEAYGHAAVDEYRRLASDHAGASRGLAQKADDLAAEADFEAGVLRRQVDRWAPAVDLWETAKRKRGGGGMPAPEPPGTLVLEQARLLENVKQERAMLTREAERLVEAERLTAETARDVEGLARAGS